MDLLIVGDTERCPELRHELPLRIGDPFPYAEIGDRGIEPALYRHGFGGVRLEDLVLVTDDGCETITTSPYDLDPAPTVGAAAR